MLGLATSPSRIARSSCPDKPLRDSRTHRRLGEQLDRVDALHLCATTFSPRSDHQPIGEAVRVQIRFAPSIIRWVHERQHFGYVAEEGAVMRYAVTDPQEMLPWILNWGAQVEVLEPATLRAQIRDEARKLLEILT